MKPKISAIVVSYNSAGYLGRCLQSLASESMRAPLEILVADNASSDGSAALARGLFPAAKVLDLGRNAGFGAACNRAAREASGEYLLFMNSDLEFLPGALTALAGALDARPRAGAACPELLGPRGELIQMSWGWDPLFLGEALQRFFSPARLAASALRRRLAARLQSRARPVPYACGAAMMVRRKTFDELHGMDEDFVLYFEDADFCRRARARGWEVLFEPAAKALHHLGKSGETNAGRVALVYRQSQWAYYRKHGAWWQRLLVKAYLRRKFRRDADFSAALEDVLEGRVRAAL